MSWSSLHIFPILFVSNRLQLQLPAPCRVRLPVPELPLRGPDSSPGDPSHPDGGVRTLQGARAPTGPQGPVPAQTPGGARGTASRPEGQ